MSDQQSGEIDRKGLVSVLVANAVLVLPAFTSMDYSAAAAIIAMVGVVLLAFQ